MLMCNLNEIQIRRFFQLNKLVFLMVSLLLHSLQGEIITRHSNLYSTFSDLTIAVQDKVKNIESRELETDLSTFILNLNQEFIGIYFDMNIPQIKFAANEIKHVLEKYHYKVKLLPLDGFMNDYPARKVVISTVEDAHVLHQFSLAIGEMLQAIEPQGYAIRTSMKAEPLMAMNTRQDSDFFLAMNGNPGWMNENGETKSEPETYWVLGGDDNGAMNGGIDLANHMQSKGMSEPFQADQVPYIAKRGVKYNVTLDGRTPSYGSWGDASANAVAHNWDMSFWTEYIDKLALYKYNVLSLWNLNPFPSLVVTKDFESLALNNVQDMSGNVILNWDIQQKIQFWKDVMAYAKSRGFEIYIFNWNVKTNGTNLPDRDDPQTKSYLRNSLYALFETYPDLDGFGFHSGENMGSSEGFNSDTEREAWLYDVYGQAFENFKQDYPDRELRLIHRLWEAQLPDIMPYWGNLSYPMDASIKYSRAHLYSYTAPNFFITDGTKSDLDQYNKKTWLNLRNDDMFYYRWGDPDYVREYVKNLPDPDNYTAGYYIGSDGYEWSRVFTNKNAPNGDLEINKHWYSHMLWGQLGYDPDTPNQYFVDSIAARFPGADAQTLFDAWRCASKIFPNVTSAFWWDWDYQWYVEGCYSTYGFRTVDDFINTEPQSSAPIYSIKEYGARLAAGLPMVDKTPIQVADELRLWADSAMTLAESIENAGNTELMLTLNDIKAMSYMGYYYSDKIAGATYKHIGDMGKFADHILAAYCNWNKVAEIASSQYYDQELSRLGNEDFSWNGLIDDAARDLGIGNLTNFCDAESPPDAPTELEATFNKADNAIDLTWSR